MKHAIVTGANAGIGFATTKALLEKGFKISMFCRDLEKAEAAKKELVTLTKNDQIDIFQVDYASLKSIEAACKEFTSKYSKLDVLVNNAGATFAGFELTEDGIERTMAVNHFGYFVMTYYILPLLLNNNSRIVNVSSKAHFGGQIDFDKINTKEAYSVFKQYENSKLANVLFTKYLADKLQDKGVAVNCLHPGVVKTKIGNKAGNKFFGLVWSLFSSFGLSIDKGAATSIHLVSSPEVADTTGMYFDKCIGYKGSELSRDVSLQAAFWHWSEKKSNLNWEF
jgi:NAD(P)-dependent dehydrogenase (short-subunit alcohol dehydrogenase family)